MLKKLLLALAATVLAATVHAQSTAPVRIVVGFPPGGGADGLARFLADRLKDRLQRPVVVENRPGAGGMVAAQAVRTSNDPATLMMANDHVMVMAPLTVRTPGYSARDFIPVAGVAGYRLAFTAHPAVQARTLGEYLDKARATDALQNVGVPAPGSLPQFMGWVLGKASGTRLNAVAYRGGAPLMVDLLGGQISASIDAVASPLENHRAGKLRILAVTGPGRMAQLPDVPTFDEAGFRDLGQSGWVGLYATAATEPALLQAVVRAVSEVMADPDVRRRVGELGFDAAYQPGAELAARTTRESTQWEAVVRQSGFAAQ